ncbi:MAG: adenosylcobinamide-GDP ribazoletransferase [Anaerovoracaceae bacterium]|nr:adenosylcobinamide-GDP ribazoletransferase [Anaerovoracaceae bacterium]
MKKVLTGLLMCWGNFCYIPGPRKWDEEARPYMLAWLPTVGFLMGLIWGLIGILAIKIQLPYIAAAAILTWVPFVISGFIHVDGYMDVNDALMSRGDLQKKRAILKDSRCGTFAIVSFVFLVLVEFGSMASFVDPGVGQSFKPFVDALISSGIMQFFTQGMGNGLINALTDAQDPRTILMSFAVIMTVPRAVSGFLMMNLDPMETSQYRMMTRDRKAGAFMVIQLLVLLVIAHSLCPRVDRFGLMMIIVLSFLGSLISCFIARHELKGMNGDIAGYGILWGELMGIVGLLI